MSIELRRRPRTNAREEEKLREAWADVPSGTLVEVSRDGGEVLVTRTRSAPWLVGGRAVILVEGIAGGYALKRVRRNAPEHTP